MLGVLCVVLFLSSVRCHEVYFSETFPNEKAIESWVASTYNGDKQGEFKVTAGSNAVDPVEDLGLQTTQDAKFYGITRKLEKTFSNKGKTLVVQFTVKYDKTVDCGGAYIKLLGSDIDQKNFHGETPYKIMFGPDICGISTKKVHVIFNYKNKNHLIKKEIRCKDDLHTHLYTLIITPDNRYEVLIDNERVEGGSIEDDWDMLPPKKIDDPSVSKPSDWVDEEEVDDPDDKKPADWDQPKTIPDMDAKKPDDWDDEMDGAWERPQKDNPDYKGEWKPKRIPNPKYRGPWVPPQIDNPEYKHDPELYSFNDIGHVGFDLWQVASGSIFDNILLTDSPKFAEEEGSRLWKPRHTGEVEKERLKESATSDKPDIPADESIVPKDDDKEKEEEIEEEEKKESDARDEL